jgi:hypothetical protein
VDFIISLLPWTFLISVAAALLVLPFGLIKFRVHHDRRLLALSLRILSIAVIIEFLLIIVFSLEFKVW